MSIICVVYNGPYIHSSFRRQRVVPSNSAILQHIIAAVTSPVEGLSKLANDTVHTQAGEMQVFRYVEHVMNLSPHSPCMAVILTEAAVADTTHAQFASPDLEIIEACALRLERAKPCISLSSPPPAWETNERIICFAAHLLYFSRSHFPF